MYVDTCALEGEMKNCLAKETDFRMLPLGVVMLVLVQNWLEKQEKAKPQRHMPMVALLNKSS